LINFPSETQKLFFMTTLISCCGLNCEGCEARIATLNDDQKLREETAAKWTEQYGATITPEMINCTGCREPGVKIGHWNECKIRLCAKEKGYESCAPCDEIDACELVGFVLKAVPEARENLRRLE
jgi:hypothetical protein